ncbi:MAG: SGNH/GDSL hydrolase family protein [Firmicutes bacterium]|nr:SGNH/GDSL hydrolase family protein [Bacillota bacterium]
MMDLTDYIFRPGELPLDRIPPDGGMTAVFRRIGCIGDSLASGEFESEEVLGQKHYHDYYEYSWGQYLARMAGLEALNFSRGGMTAEAIIREYGDLWHMWDQEKLCQAYIIALGVNDLVGRRMPAGTLDQIDFEDWRNNGTDTFVSGYARILLRLQSLQPKGKFFLVTMPRNTDAADDIRRISETQAELMRGFADRLPNTYVIDLMQYGPDYNNDFRKRFFLGGHMNPMGYLLTARMFGAYIDYYIRREPGRFAEAGFIGTPYHNLHTEEV